MSKILIALFLIILIQNVCAETNHTEISEQFYQYVKDLFIGLVKDNTDINKSKCIQVITNRKQYILDNIEEIVKGINDTQVLFEKLIENGLNILTIHGFAKNCRIINFVFFYNKLTQENEIISIGETIHNNATLIADIFNPAIKDSLFKKVGNFSKHILNLVVK